MPTEDSKSAKIVGKEELSHLVAAKAHVDLKEADTMIDAFTETIREQVAKGNQVRLIGFGSWKLTAVSARTIKSIRGGTPLHLPAGKRVSFSTGSLLAKASKAPAPSKKASAAKRPSKKEAK
jgi:DNA-binding protein HU-beta